MLLDRSSAFHTVDHGILLRRLHTKFGISGKVLDWFASYLPRRSQRVIFEEGTSDSFNLNFGVPEGSCLRPLLFTVHATETFQIIESHLLDAHCFGDDSQLKLSFKPDNSTSLSEAVLVMEKFRSDL